jgi:hypothetical protein
MSQHGEEGENDKKNMAVSYASGAPAARTQTLPSFREVCFSVDGDELAESLADHRGLASSSTSARRNRFSFILLTVTTVSARTAAGRGAGDVIKTEVGAGVCILISAQACIAARLAAPFS